MKQALQHEEQQGGPNPLNAGANPVMLPHNFYEQELRNPRRNNQFAKVSENLINRLPASKIGHQKLQEEMINYDEHKKEEEVEMYKNLVRISQRFPIGRIIYFRFFFLPKIFFFSKEERGGNSSYFQFSGVSET